MCVREKAQGLWVLREETLDPDWEGQSANFQEKVKARRRFEQGGCRALPSGPAWSRIWNMALETTDLQQLM